MKENLFEMHKEVLKVLFYVGWGLFIFGTFVILFGFLNIFQIQDEFPTIDELNEMDDRQLMLDIRSILAKCAADIWSIGAIISGSFLIKLSNFNNRNSEK